MNRLGWNILYIFRYILVSYFSFHILEYSYHKDILLFSYLGTNFYLLSYISLAVIRNNFPNLSPSCENPQKKFRLDKTKEECFKSLTSCMYSHIWGSNIYRPWSSVLNIILLLTFYEKKNLYFGFLWAQKKSRLLLGMDQASKNPEHKLWLFFQ